MDYLEINSLYHHGIKGQKWGIRRYQNEDGSLTDAGKARYNDDGTKKKAKDMSDDDLRKSNSRLQSEANYNSLRGQTYKNPKSAVDILIKSGVSATGSFLATFGGISATQAIMKQNINIGKNAAIGLIAAAAAALGSITSSLGGQTTSRNYNDFSTQEERAEQKAYEDYLKKEAAKKYK